MSMTAGAPRSPMVAARLAGRVLGVVVPLALFGLLWLALGPAQAGASATYVVTTGTSMLPTMEAGGLVVLRERDGYEVGDVVGYRNPFLADAVVLHRVVALDADRYVLRGDNNDEDDRFRPTLDDMVGERWAYAAGAGGWFLALHEPQVAGMALALATLAALYRAPQLDARRRRRHH